MTLTRLPDPSPDVWIDDLTQVMQFTTGGHYASPEHPSFGNFWAKRPCLIRPHNWALLSLTNEAKGLPRQIVRCQRCGSQVHQGITISPPHRGRV